MIIDRWRNDNDVMCVLLLLWRLIMPTIDISNGRNVYY